MLKRTIIPMFLLLLAGPLYSSVLAQVPATKVRIAYSRFWTAPALLVGKEMGFFDREKIKPDWKEFKGPAVRAIEAMAAGDIDMTIVTEPSYLIARDRGVKITAVALAAGRSSPYSALFVKKGSGINKIEDLKGRKISVAGFASNFDLYTRYILDKHNINPKKDVVLLEISFPTTFKALLSGKIDAGWVPPLFVILAREKFKDKLKILVDYTDFDIIGKKFNVMIMVMSNDFIKNRRKAAKAFLRGYLESIKFVNADHKRGLRIWSKATKLGLIGKMKELPFLPSDGKIDLPAMQVPIDLLNRFGFVKGKYQAKDLVDNSLLDEVIAGR